MLAPQLHEQVGLGLKAVVGAVVDHRRQIAPRFQDGREMSTLSRRRTASRQQSRDQHQPRRSDCLGVSRVFRRESRILCSGANHDRHSRLDQPPDPLLPLLIGEQRPVPHRPAIHHGAHPDIDQLPRLTDERLVVHRAIRKARRHQRRHAATKDIRRRHPVFPFELNEKACSNSASAGTRSFYRFCK